MKKKKKKIQRFPRKPVNIYENLKPSDEIVFTLASLGNSEEDIASLVGCGTAKLRKNFKEILIKGRAARNDKLRRMQMYAAQRGSPSILQWLGRQYLGQKTTVDIVLSGELDVKNDVRDALKNLSHSDLKEFVSVMKKLAENGKDK